MTLTSYTFRIERDDGTIEERTVSTSFGDLPVDLIARMVPLTELEKAAALLAYRLDIPLEVAQRLVDELNAGTGIVEA